MIVNEVENVPPLPTVTRWARLIPLHDTGTLLLTGAGRATVGWAASLLHWRTVPEALASNPEPATVTTDPALRPVEGVIVSDAAALAAVAKASPPAPDSIKTAAIPTTTRRWVPLSIHPPIPNRDTTGRIRTVTPPYGPIPPLRPRQKL
jgi:hypothetical protein